MNCDLENSFLLVYLSEPLIITHGPRGAAPADTPPLSGPANDDRFEDLNVKILENTNLKTFFNGHMFLNLQAQVLE